MKKKSSFFLIIRIIIINMKMRINSRIKDKDDRR